LCFFSSWAGLSVNELFNLPFYGFRFFFEEILSTIFDNGNPNSCDFIRLSVETGNCFDSYGTIGHVFDQDFFQGGEGDFSNSFFILPKRVIFSDMTVSRRFYIVLEWFSRLVFISVNRISLNWLNRFRTSS